VNVSANGGSLLLHDRRAGGIGCNLFLLSESERDVVTVSGLHGGVMRRAAA